MNWVWLVLKPVLLIMSLPPSMSILRNGELGMSKNLDSELNLCAQLPMEERKGEKEEAGGWIDGATVTLRRGWIDGTTVTLRLTSELFPMLNTYDLGDSFLHLIAPQNWFHIVGGMETL